ncbi:MAG: type II toxin-antitoxin system Phd/YefM family antitoxin, partial [Clostridiales bacterium]|nr:type II toxin-antitoxin system Phd/YefM family antitoxin [Clostridiales bacterium]
LIEFSSAEEEQTARDEDVLAVSKRLLAKNREAYEVLAK